MKKFFYKFRSKELFQKIKYLIVFIFLLAPLVFCIFLRDYPGSNGTSLAVDPSTMHHTNVIGISLLFAAFFLEFLLILWHIPNRKMVKDTMANFLIGIGTIVVGAIEKGSAFGLYSFAYTLSIFKAQPCWWLWIIGFLSCDFMHYAYHWLGHKTRLFWAAHITHHSSQYFNLSTGLRTNGIHLFYRFVFWSPLCILGIPPEMILFIESITASQNFLVHTEKIGKLPILDWIFNTPSNHRVHHGSNPEYIDKNLGGMLMIYDHLFGTYAKETTPPVYGITHNIDTHNPLKIMFHEHLGMAEKFSKMKGTRAKLNYLFSKPQ
jgi:sterol desaturase/sphingolipid hydroxylase (fatty acid hydroxylase superfamily)